MRETSNERLTVKKALETVNQLSLVGKYELISTLLPDLKDAQIDDLINEAHAVYAERVNQEFPYFHDLGKLLEDDPTEGILVVLKNLKAQRGIRAYTYAYVVNHPRFPKRQHIYIGRLDLLPGRVYCLTHKVNNVKKCLKVHSLNPDPEDAVILLEQQKPKLILTVEWLNQGESIFSHYIFPDCNNSPLLSAKKWKIEDISSQLNSLSDPLEQTKASQDSETNGAVDLSTISQKSVAKSSSPRWSKTQLLIKPREVNQVVKRLQEYAALSQVLPIDSRWTYEHKDNLHWIRDYQNDILIEFNDCEPSVNCFLSSQALTVYLLDIAREATLSPLMKLSQRKLAQDLYQRLQFTEGKNIEELFAKVFAVGKNSTKSIESIEIIHNPRFKNLLAKRKSRKSLANHE
jgi:hypothetical protein